MECQKSFQIPWCITKSCHQLFPLVSWTPEQSVSSRFLKKHDFVSFRRFHFSANWLAAPPLFLNNGLSSAKSSGHRRTGYLLARHRGLRLSFFSGVGLDTKGVLCGK